MFPWQQQPLPKQQTLIDPTQLNTSIPSSTNVGGGTGVLMGVSSSSANNPPVSSSSGNSSGDGASVEMKSAVALSPVTVVTSIAAPAIIDAQSLQETNIVTEIFTPTFINVLLFILVLLLIFYGIYILLLRTT